MGFLKKLFGGGASARTPSEADLDSYQGFTIVADPVPEGGQYRLAGTISKEMDGETKDHRLIRADIFTSRDEAVQFTLRKARQVIDEQGERMFR